MQGKYDEARSAFEDARANFLKLGHETEAALFLQSLDNILSQSGLGQYPKSLSNAHLMQGQYDEAISTLDDAQDTKSSAESTSESSDAIRSTRGTLQSQEETAMYIEEMVECVHVFELSALYIAQQGVRRACAFRAWSLILEEQMELGLKQTSSTHEKISICRQLLDFQIQTSDRQKSLDRHLNIVKQLFEVLTDCEITNVVSPENISTAVIMSWVIINSAEELEHMVDDKRHAAFSKAVRRDAIQFLRLESNSGQTNSDLKVKFSHIYDTLLQEYVRRVNTLNSNDGVIEAPPLRRYYTLTELIRLAAGHLSFLKDMENDLGMLWTCSPSSPHQRITNDSSFPRSSQQKFSHTKGCSELPTSFQPFESTSLQQTQKPAYVSSSEALHTPSTEQRTWTVRDFVSCPSSESPKHSIQNFEEQNTSDVIDPLWSEAKNYHVQQLHRSDVAVISHHDLTKRISIDTSIHRGDATHLYKGTIREDGSEIKVAVRILQAMRNPSIRTTFGKVSLATVMLKYGSNSGLSLLHDQRFFQDFQIWISLRHPNLVPFLGFTTQSDLPYALVSPWYRNSNIGDYLRHLWPDKVQIRTQLIRDIAEGIGYLHAIKIVHGDIQMNTVLVDDNGVARVAEPGILHFVKDISSYGGTPRTNFQNYRFLAPELLDVDDPTIKSDIWAFGCLASLVRDFLQFKK
ncbi:hypothetical protein FRC02_000913 [Tulasnella sp. 418]|nr:hypothetical protein FRC02_000913 [Tulasnella sp. 418]